jgi:GT2 family glycosyltransferase
MINDAIIVLAYNKVRQTKECIDSIILSGYPKCNIFCLDNGSKQEFFDELKELYPNINYKRYEKNSGYSGGFNRAMRWVFSFEYEKSLFLTNDTRLLPDTLKEINKTAKDTAAGLVAPSIHYLSNPESIDSIGGYFDAKAGTLHHYRDDGISQLLNGKWDYIPGTALWIKKSAFETLNGMNEKYHTYWEDVDFSFRARKNKILLAKSKNAVILHGVGKTCHKKPKYTTYYFQRNRVVFCKTHLKENILSKCLKEVKKDILNIKKKFELKNDTKRLNYINKVLKDF